MSSPDAGARFLRALILAAIILIDIFDRDKFPQAAARPAAQVAAEILKHIDDISAA